MNKLTSIVIDGIWMKHVSIIEITLGIKCILTIMYDIMSWIIATQMKNHFVSDTICNIVNL